MRQLQLRKLFETVKAEPESQPIWFMFTAFPKTASERWAYRVDIRPVSDNHLHNEIRSISFLQEISILRFCRFDVKSCLA